MTRSALVLLALLALPACGGHIILGFADGGTGDGTGSGAAASQGSASRDGGATGSTAGGGGGGTGEWFPVCPGVQPTPGLSCPTPSQGCAYVNLQAGTCVSWTCNAHHQWESSTPAGC